MATISGHDLATSRMCTRPGCPNVSDGPDDLCRTCRAAQSVQRGQSARVAPLPVDALGLTIDPRVLDDVESLALLRRLVKAHDGVAFAVGDLLAVKFPYEGDDRSRARRRHREAGARGPAGPAV